MKELLNAWYEITVIPAIVLACMTGLGQGAINYLQYGFYECSIGLTVFAFFMFLVLMTIEDCWKLLKDLVTALDELENTFTH